MRLRLQIGLKNTRFREDVIAEDRLSELVLLFFRGEIEKKRKPFGSFLEAFRKLFGGGAFLFTLFARRCVRDCKITQRFVTTLKERF